MRDIPACSKQAINDGLASSNLVIHQLSTTEIEAIEVSDRSTLKVKLQNALAVIIANEKEEARQIDIGYQKRSWIGKEIAESWHFVTGIALAGYGMAEQAYELAHKASEIHDVVSSRARLIHSIRYAYIAAGKTVGTDENFSDAFAKEQLAGNKRQLAEALAVLPSALDLQKLAQAFEFAELIWADIDLRAMLGQFGIDYVKAQHKLEQAEMAGGIAFEVILTVILAALTAGAGVAASAASQTRHVAKFGKVGKLLMKFGEALRDIKRRAKSRGVKASKGKSASFSDFEDAGSANTNVKSGDTKTLPKAKFEKKKSQKKKVKKSKAIKSYDNLEDLNRAANNPDPDTIYKYNDYKWETDSSGRVMKASGKVRLNKADGRSGTDGVSTVKIGKEGEDGDIGFHLIGDQFDGPTNRLNVVPGNGKRVDPKGKPNLNQGQYARFESAVKKAKQDPANQEKKLK